MYSKNIYKNCTNEKIKEINSFNESYKDFISKGKTERLCVKLANESLEKSGNEELNSIIAKGLAIKPGCKLYVINRDKNIIAFRMGKRPLIEGLRILGAHIDSPRLDAKQNPLYEKNDFSLLDTHYYGGIKKYQWVTIP